MQGSPTNSQYEGRNPDGSSFRSQFPMGNNEPVLRNQPALLGQFRPQPPMPQDQKPGFEGLDQAYINQSMQQQMRIGNNPPRPRVMTQGPESMLEQPLREEVGDTFNRRIQGQMGQSQGRGAPQQMQVYLGTYQWQVRQARQREMNLMSHPQGRMQQQQQQTH
jgi:hypothetical protein